MSDIQNLTASLDLKQNLNIYAACKQSDNLKLILLVYDNSVQANLTNYNVRMKAMKADKVPLIQEHTGITITNNIVTIDTDEQLTTTAGKTLIELQFINMSTGERKATFNLVLVVSPSALEVDRKISTATYTLLQELENKFDQATDFFENIDEAIDANNTLATSITSATTSKTNLDVSIATAGTTKTALDTSNTTANTTKTALNTSITNANASKSALDTSKTNADASKVALDLSISESEQFAEAHQDIENLVEQVNSNSMQLSDVAHKTGTMQTNLNADMIDGIQGNQIPLKTIVDITYYVNTSTGLDTNDGLTSVTAFKTIQYAINKTPQIINNTITINIANGTYNESILIRGFSGAGALNLIGNNTTPDNVIINNITCRNVVCDFSISGFIASTITGYSFSLTGCLNVALSYCKSIVVASINGFVFTRCFASIQNSTISNKNNGIVCSGSIVSSTSNSGTGNTNALYADLGGTLGKNGTQPSGTVSEYVYAGGVIR